MAKRNTPVRIDKEQYDELARISEEEGIPITEQVRRAVREWLEKRREKKVNS